ncbi:iron complex transport system permease protein [Clostridium pascui]|uniref:FecCD family ABC transporter permease n=1 Tax=Clostridium pascui TaxID=46609 RepID=UPI001958EF27|nr:iron ABC transporter permease [Clostridium pascui]MBM7871662.1 iron complex transport system permease protein [Clostridium pascui]
MRENKRFIPFGLKLLLGIVALTLMFAIAMVFGAADISIKDVWLALTSNEAGSKISIVREIRLPREIAAIFVGAALAVAGAVMQGMTKNPLADPGLLGLTAGANAALAITIAFFSSANYFIIIAVCFIGAAAGVILVFGISSAKKGGFSSFRIVLAGTAVSAFLYAVSEGIGIYFKVSKEVSMWTAGGIVGTSWSQLKIVIPFILIGLLTAMYLSKQLTIISLSEEVAIGLGQNIRRIKIILFIVITLLAGASVALVGNMAFVGLMIPHMVRAIVGTDYKFIIPMSMVLGATLMLLADTLARTINAPYETPIAAIMSVVGIPFFLFIVRRGGKMFS